MANVLYLAHALPYPLDAGPKVRQHYMLRHLAGRHDVTLVAFARDEDSPQARQQLLSFCRDVRTAPVPRSAKGNVCAGIKGLVTGMPIVVARDESAHMRRLLAALVAERRFDVIHADQLSMAGYGDRAARAAARCGARPAILLDEHNAVYLLTQRMAMEELSGLRRALLGREAVAFRRYEAEMCRQFDAVLTVTQADASALLALAAPGDRPALARKLAVAPICVDPDRTPVVRRVPGGPPTILHLGTMFWPPNAHGALWFAAEVLPLVRREVPAARFVVVGKNPPPEVRVLAADPLIEVTGYVEDPVPYLAAADVLVVPLAAGGGMRVKILEAWMRGLPVVSTRTGAEGIAATDGADLLLAPDRDAAAFAAAVIRTLTDARLNDQLRLAGRQTVEACYSWRSVYSRVDDVYARLLSTGSPDD